MSGDSSLAGRTMLLTASSAGISRRPNDVEIALRTSNCRLRRSADVSIRAMSGRNHRAVLTPRNRCSSLTTSVLTTYPISFRGSRANVPRKRRAETGGHGEIRPETPAFRVSDGERAGASDEHLNRPESPLNSVLRRWERRRIRTLRTDRHRRGSQRVGSRTFRCP